MSDSGALAVAGFPTPQPDLSLKYYMIPFSTGVISNELKVLEKASGSSKRKQAIYSKKIAPQMKPLDKDLDVVNGKITKLDQKILKTKYKDPNKKALIEERKPLAEEARTLMEGKKQVKQTQVNLEKTDSELAKLKREATQFNFRNHAILDSLSRHDPESAGSRRNQIAELDKIAEDYGVAASTFTGLSYGGGGSLPTSRDTGGE